MGTFTSIMKKETLLTKTVFVATCIGLLPTIVHAQQKPNILIIYTDDMGIGDLSCYNNGWSKTPNIDKLASQGIKFNKYYSAAPVSSPSRVGLTTGMFPLQMGINTYLQSRQRNAKCEQYDFLDSNVPTMADAMKSVGYASGHFGKWHMGGGRDVDNAPQITQYGFDEYVSTWESPDPDPLITDSDWIWSNNDSIKRWNRSAYFVDKTLAFLKKHQGEPTFVNFWPDDMHTPWVQGPGVQDKENSWTTPPNFAAVLKEYDAQIGRLLQGLKDLGLEENTIVIFTSDNGPAPSFQQKRTNNLRGVKCSLYEGGILMPFMVRWPGKIPAGKVDNQSVICAVDLLPSLGKITGAKLPSGSNYSGEDMSRALTGTPQTRKKDLMWEFGRNAAFAQPIPYQKSPHLAIRRGNMKLLTNSDSTSVELYDLSKDPQETTNIALKNPELVKDLQKIVFEWWNSRPNKK